MSALIDRISSRGLAVAATTVALTVGLFAGVNAWALDSETATIPGAEPPSRVSVPADREPAATHLARVRTAVQAEQRQEIRAARKARKAKEARERQERREAERAAAAAAAEAARQMEQEASRSAERSYSGDARGIAADMAASRYGWAADQFSCLDSLWGAESGWDPYAQNPSSGAYGIPQALPGSKMAEYGSDWQSNPATQIAWGLAYVDGRYGSPCSAWSTQQSQGWY
jgi:hypothetical protein